MKTQLRLESVGKDTVGGPEAGAMSLIYTMLLREYGMNAYSSILVNQIKNDLQELIINEGKNIHINIRYPVDTDFESKGSREKNQIRLDIIHTALMRIAHKDKKLDVDKLNAIKKRITENDFCFEFLCKEFVNARNRNLKAKIIVLPRIDKFDYYVEIIENGKLKCKLHIYSGVTNLFYFSGLFNYGKWASDNEFIITGKEKETAIHVFLDKGRVECLNLTKYDKAPFFEMMRADISEEERERAKRDWQHSLPPAYAAIIRKSNN